MSNSKATTGSAGAAGLDNLTKLIRYLETHNGRDKIVRLFQYSARFISWSLINNNKAADAKKYQTLEETSSLARKVFRLGKSISLLQNAFRTFNEEHDGVLKTTVVVQQISLSLWLFLDHIIWATKIGLIKSDTPKHARRANTFWLIAMLAGIVKSCYLLQQTQQIVSHALATGKGESVSSARKAQLEHLLELLRNIFDVPIPLTGLNQTVQKTIPTGIVGLCGSVSSIIGIYQVWSKIK